MGMFNNQNSKIQFELTFFVPIKGRIKEGNGTSLETGNNLARRRLQVIFQFWKANTANLANHCQFEVQPIRQPLRSNTLEKQNEVLPTTANSISNPCMLLIWLDHQS